MDVFVEAETQGLAFVLDGSGPASLEPPKLEEWPEITREAGGNVRRVNLDTVTRDEIKDWRPGDTLLLNGKMLTGRDAAHQRIQQMLARGEALPLHQVREYLQRVAPGKIVATHYEYEFDRWVYEFKIINPQGQLRKVHIDARNGELVKLSDY